MTNEDGMHAPQRNLIEQLADAKNLIGQITTELNDTRRQMATNFRTMAEHVATSQRLEKENAELRESNDRLGKIYTARGVIFAELRRVLDGEATSSVGERLPLSLTRDEIKAACLHELRKPLASDQNGVANSGIALQKLTNAKLDRLQAMPSPVRLEPQQAWRHLDEQRPESFTECVSVDSTKPHRMSLQQKTAALKPTKAMIEDDIQQPESPPIESEITSRPERLSMELWVPVSALKDVFEDLRRAKCATAGYRAEHSEMLSEIIREMRDHLQSGQKKRGALIWPMGPLGGGT